MLTFGFPSVQLCDKTNGDYCNMLVSKYSDKNRNACTADENCQDTPVFTDSLGESYTKGAKKVCCSDVNSQFKAYCKSPNSIVMKKVRSPDHCFDLDH